MRVYYDDEVDALYLRLSDETPVRLPNKRWIHIVETHDDMAGHYHDVLSAIEEPDYIIKGYRDALIALKKVSEIKYLAVVYKELSAVDGFVITSYFTSKIKLEKEVILWKKK